MALQVGEEIVLKVLSFCHDGNWVVGDGLEGEVRREQPTPRLCMDRSQRRDVEIGRRRLVSMRPITFVEDR